VRRQLPANWDNVSVAAWAGLTVTFCQQHRAGVIIRGVGVPAAPGWLAVPRRYRLW
jgi:pantetheine-phosphate adenylyltransferase